MSLPYCSSYWAMKAVMRPVLVKMPNTTNGMGKHFFNTDELKEKIKM